jgi:GMP synthase (glutamine-hydrolysing)
MRVHIIQHEVFEAPAAYLKWALARNYALSFSKVYEYQPLPQTAENIDLLIVMGGPQSPNTSIAECPHFDAAAEIALIKQCIEAKRAVVGVCLGAQLIGQALGAPYAHSPEREIGVFPIQLSDAGQKDAKLAHFGNMLLVGHWHNDMPGLTDNCQLLASSAGCPRQIVAYDNCVYGFQCHMEFDQDTVKMLIEADNASFSADKKFAYVQQPEEIIRFDYSEMNHKLEVFLDKLVDSYQAQIRL